MGKLKQCRQRALLLLMVFALFFCLCVSGSASDNTSSEWPVREYQFSVGIYNEMTASYALTNRTVSGMGPFSLNRSVSLLRQSGAVEDCTEGGGRLLSVTYTVESTPVTLQESASRKFYVKLNGDIVPESDWDRYIGDGDIVEWFYTTANEYEQLQSLASSSGSKAEGMEAPASDWSDDISSARTAACDWLDSNAAASEDYLIAVGCAGRTADIRTVNRLLADVRQGKDKLTGEPLSRQVLMLSFCGFDAGNSDLSDLLTKLMNCEGLEQQDYGISHTLTAYDCRTYTIPNSALNSRSKLISDLLKLQTANGGFAASVNEAEHLEPTAEALIALSAYRSMEEVQAAADRAVDYLAGLQKRGGGFLEQGSETSGRLSRVITALSSVGVALNDERFLLDEQDLLTRLMEYRRSDGGFARHIEDKNGEASSTEQAVIALSSIRRNGNPFLVSASLHNTVPVSSQTQVQEISDGRNLYLLAGALLLILVVLLALIALLLKKRTSKRH